jgi:hypothetical protein
MKRSRKPRTKDPAESPGTKQKTRYEVRCRVEERGRVLKGTLTVVAAPDGQDVLASHTANLLDGAERGKSARVLARQLPGVKPDEVSGVAAKLLPLIDAAWNAEYTRHLRAREEEEKARQAAEAEREARASAAGYVEQDGVLCRQRFDHAGKEALEPLCNFTARITEEVVRDDGAETSIVVRVEGSLIGGEPLPPATVAGGEFLGMGWVFPAWGSRAVMYAGQGVRDSLRAAVQILSGDVPRRLVYTHTGWRQIKGEWRYLHGGRCQECQVANVEVDLPAALQHMVLPSPPKGDALRQAVRASINAMNVGKLRVTVPGLGATYRAPLGPCTVSVHQSGPTGSFKTELAALLQQHFGAGFTAENLPASWISTANATEGLAFAAKDMLLVIDDFAPGGTTTDVARKHNDADRLFRGAGNRQGRQRMSANGTLRPHKPARCLFLSTGEDLPRGHSVRARVVAIQVGKGDVYANRLTACQKEAREGLYASAMSAYVAWLAPRYDEVAVGLKEEAEKLRIAWSKGEQHRRTPTNLAQLELGWRYFLRFALESEAISKAEHDEYLEEVAGTLTGVGKAQKQIHQDADPAVQFLRLIQASINSGAAHVAGVPGQEPGQHPEAWGWRQRTVGVGEHERVEWQAQGARVGWLDGENLYLDPDAAFAAGQALAAKKGESLPVSARTLGSLLKERGVITTEKARESNMVRRKVEGKQTDVWWLRSRGFFSSAQRNAGHEPGEESPGPPLSPDAQPDIPDINGEHDEQVFEMNGFTESPAMSG